MNDDTEGTDAQNDDIVIVFEQTELLDDTAAVQRFEAGLAQAPGKLKKLEDEAKKRGFKPSTGPKSSLALRHKFRAEKPVKPPQGEHGTPVQELQFDISLRAFEKANSDDQAAVATVTVTAGQNSDQYDLLLEAPAGNMAKAREFKVEGDKIVPANSWWSAARSCVTSKCGSVCVGSLITCSGSWAAYLLCVAVRCGGCWVRCAACSSCNCRWWCKWATGCCHQ